MLKLVNMFNLSNSKKTVSTALVIISSAFSISFSQDSVQVTKDTTTLQLPSKTGYSSIFYHSGRYVMAGADGIIYSDDFINWKEATVVSKRKHCVRDIAYFKNNFIAVGYAYTTMAGVKNWTALKSKDGSEWVDVSINRKKAMKSMGIKSGYGLWGIAANDSVAVACGAIGKIFYTSDGTSWEKANLKDIPGTSPFFSICYTGKAFIAVGAFGRIITSQNGKSWSLLPTPTEEHLFDVTASSAMCVAVGVNGTVLTNRESSNWELVKVPASEKSDKLTSIVFANNEFIAAGYLGRVQFNKKLEAPLQSLMLGKAYFPTVYQNNNTIFYNSKDGITWTRNQTEIDKGIQDIIWDGSKYICTSNALTRSAILK